MGKGGGQSEFLTVPELAALLRIKERKVYDLAAAGTVPCSRATGKLLFPEQAVRAWIARESTGAPADPVRPAILLGSHDPLIDWAIRASGCGLATYLDGATDGLERFRTGAGVAAGLHLFDAATGQWNVPAVAQAFEAENVALIEFAKRQRGLVLRADGPRPAVLADLAGLRMAARQEGSGTAQLYAHLAVEAGLDPGSVEIAETALTETEAVQAVARGTADVTFGLEAIARDFALPFVPVVEERFDILVDRRAWFEPPLQALMAFCRSEQFRARAAALGGYDVSGCGTVVWNA
jgi:excisionase family DNA binding protein